MSNKKIITMVVTLLILAVIIVIMVSKQNSINDELYNVESYSLEPLKYYDQSTEDDYIIVKYNYEYRSFIRNKHVRLDEYDEEKISEKDFDNYSYLLVYIPTNTCGETVEYGDIDINKNKKRINLEFEVEETCGVCASSYELYEITIPKYITTDYEVEIDYDVTKATNCDPIIAYKPVLYLYPEKETNIKVTFDNPNNLTTTYPKYNNGWEVRALPNGNLYDKNNNYYYALYWESKIKNNINFKEGFYVSSNNVINFLEEKLTILGLNPKEKNEFIIYWLPILEENKHSLVYFETTEEINKYENINISPKPDTLIRIRMHIKKVSEKEDIKKQNLIKPNRTGFIAVEWGGVIHE